MDDSGGVAVVVDLGGEKSAGTHLQPRFGVVIGILWLAGLVAISPTFAFEKSGPPAGPVGALSTVVADWEATFNAGNLSNHLELFNESSVVGGQLLKLADDFAAELAWEFEWDPRIDLYSCVTTDMQQASCQFAKTDEFLSPTGLTERGVAEFALDPADGRLARVDLLGDPDDAEAVAAFYTGFHAWVESTHPEISLTGRHASRDRDTWTTMRDAYLEELHRGLD